jgi:DNA invertase Pin-like site-specific DNA recombinase
MKIGYARTSTADQEAGLDDQLAKLRAAGCEEVFSEQLLSVGRRPALEDLIRFLRQAPEGKGDVVVVTKLDRFARSVLDFWELLDRIEAKGGGLIILDFGGNTIDSRSAAGRAILNIFASIAQFEREVMLERQRVGIARAKADGKYARNGRPASARGKAAEVRRLVEIEGLSKAETARRLKIGEASVYRILGDGKRSAG